MKPHTLHREILTLVQLQSGKPTQHTFLDGYLGTKHPRYAINLPTMRKIAGAWLKGHRDISAEEFAEVLTSLIHAPSYTEKLMAGILLSMAPIEQQKFKPNIFGDWLGQLEGWAEVDSLCTGKYSERQLLMNLARWRKMLADFSRSPNIHKRRASLVLLCSPLRKEASDTLLALALENTERLKTEKEILITKAISWVLRSAAIHQPAAVKKYVLSNKASLPAIAVRETLTKINTGTKTKRTKK